MNKRIAVAIITTAIAVMWARGTFAMLKPPDRVILSDRAMSQIIGGASSAYVNVAFPQNYITSSPGVATAWNKAGNRCQFACASGPTDVGFNASASIFVVSGLPAPKLEVYSDGVKTAVGNSLFWWTVTDNNHTFNQDHVYDVYTANLLTRCSALAPGDIFYAGCSNDSFCLLTGRGHCRMCDQFQCNNESPNTTAAPCVSQPSQDACYLLADCIGTSGNSCTSIGPNCLKSGVKGDQGNSNGSLHSVLARAVTTDSSNNTIVIGQTEHLYNVVQANSSSPATTCSTNCSGGIDASINGNAAPQCEQ